MTPPEIAHICAHVASCEEEDEQVEHDVASHTDLVEGDLVDLLQKVGHTERGDGEGHGGDETRVEHHQLVVEDVVGHEDLQRAQHAAPRREEEGEVVDEQIFVGEKIFEHPPHRKTLLRGRDGGALFALEAEGDHEPERHDGADERHPEVG